MENDEITAKEARKLVNRYMVKHTPQKALLVAVKGERIVQIYIDRGFTEISESEYKQLLQEWRETLEGKG